MTNRRLGCVHRVHSAAMCTTQRMNHGLCLKLYHIACVYSICDMYTHLWTLMMSPPPPLRPCAARSFSHTSQLSAKPRQSPGSADGDESLPQPIKFSTSKASHRTWKVESSMGSRFQRPWWQVLSLSVFTFGFLLWCVFRQESDIDRALEKQLFEHFPGLLTNMEEEREELKKEPDDGSK